MKASAVIHLVIGLLIISLMSLSPPASAQDSTDSGSPEKYSREELAQMLAPIALYPDALLSQVLMASTYPIEVVEADRWINKNQDLKDDALDTALLDKNWAPSVKALCHFPTVLNLMSERITETTNLGNAFLVQEEEVMDMVQELRTKAHDQGNLTTDSQQKVIVEKETIIIEPADPRVIYVPYYDPLYIYGPWWYPAYPPYYWGPVGVSIGVGISYWPGFHFGFVFGNWIYFDWHRHFIHIHVHQRPRFVRHDRWIAKSGRWHHAPRHRRGVAYRDKFTARKFGQHRLRTREFRRETRGFPARRDIDRTRIERDRRERQRVERELQERKQIQRDRQERPRVDQERLRRERVERDRKIRPRTDLKERTQQPPVRGKTVIRQRATERRRDNVFNRIEDGRRERASSNRGKFSRQGRGRDSSGRSPVGRTDRGGREDLGRKRR